MYGMNGYPSAMGIPAMNPSPFQYPPPSVFGTQNMQPQPQQPTQAQQTGPDWIQVATAQQVEQVSVQPGGKAWIMVQNAPIFALRVADNMGLATTDFYRFEKIDANAATGASNGVSSTGVGITREEVEAIVAERLSAFADSFKPTSAKSKKEESVK